MVYIMANELINYKILYLIFNNILWELKSISNIKLPEYKLDQFGITPQEFNEMLNIGSKRGWVKSYQCGFDEYDGYCMYINFNDKSEELINIFKMLNYIYTIETTN